MPAFVPTLLSLPAVFSALDLEHGSGALLFFLHFSPSLLRIIRRPVLFSDSPVTHAASIRLDRPPPDRSEGAAA